jgi:FAD/FMN-containing dehydrogenase
MAQALHYRPQRGPLVSPGDAEVHARDMTATFSAEMTLREAQRRLAEAGQWLPIDGPADEPLGKLVEFNSTGPLRLGYGAWRDLLLGVQFNNGRGELVTAGGRTVKNVAGYDLTKFMVGQRGIFGRIVTLTTRTYRRPASALLARFEPDVTLPGKLLPSDLRPQWIVMTSDALYCGYLADATTVDWYYTNVDAMGPIQALRRSPDLDIEHRAELWAMSVAPSAFRASVPPVKVLEFAGEIESAAAGRAVRWSADAAFGVVLGELDDDVTLERVRAAALRLGGTVTACGDASAPLDAPAVASTNTAERQIIEQLKSAFDPDGNLAPLPWQTR